MNQLDIAPSPWNSVHVATATDGTRSVAAVTDGAGFWGRGPEAAISVGIALRTKWQARVPSPDEVLSDLRDALEALPTDIRDDEGGHDFCFAAVLLEDSVVTVLTSGWYGVVTLKDSRPTVIHQPQMWVDQQVAAGLLTEDQADNHAFRHVYTGQTVKWGHTELSRFRIAPSETIVVAEAAVLRRLRVQSPAETTWSAAAFQSLDPERTHVVIVCRPAA